MSASTDAQAACFVHLQRVRELAHDERRPQRDRDALLAVLAMVDRLMLVVKRYRASGAEELGDIDVEASELIAEIGGRP